MAELQIVKYNPELKRNWDDFISLSKNGLFLFNRDYMDYHADRFDDFSLLFYEGNRLSAIMPANIKESEIYSHGGLTFGGIVSEAGMRTPLMLEIFDLLKDYLKENNLKKIIYKSVPYIYHAAPADEDLYALFRNDARLIRRDVSSTIFMQEKITFSKGRKWSVKKARGSELSVEASSDFRSFMQIEAETLMKRYGVKPTHTTEEIELLAGRFPDYIKLFAAFKAGVMLAGVIVYENRNVVHTQYIASNDEGKELYAVDLIIDYLINEHYKSISYFDFGISTEQDGRFLNVGLVRQKEEYGARAVVFDTYELVIN